MKIDISLSTAGVAKRLQQIERDLPRALDTALYATAQHAENLILDRTREGRGIKGTFRPYSARYAKAKRDGWPASKEGAKTYRSAFSGDRSGVVNLNVTGSMLNAMTAIKGRGYAEIKFTRAAESKKAYFNNKLRPFFGFNATERRQLTEFMKRRLFK